MLDRCLFGVRLGHPDEKPLVERRAAALARWYGGRLELRFSEALRLLWGEVRPGGERRRLGSPNGLGFRDILTWSDDPLIGAAELVRASDARLRALPPGCTAFAVAGRAAVIAGGPAGPAALYSAECGGLRAWSTHAVAAGWLARGAVRLDPDAVAELVATELVGGERTVVEQVRTLPAATRVTITPSGVSERSYWPPAERWAPLPAAEAAAVAEAELLRGLERRLAGRAPTVGLTAGLDSAMAAAALVELGLPFDACTYGDPAAPDPRGAATTASCLGVPHRVVPIELWDDVRGLERVRAEARWNEAGAPVSFGSVAWPAGLSTWLTGMGAETGRAFHYAWALPRRERVSAGRATRALAASGFAFRLLDADPEVRAGLDRLLRERVDEARALGHAGWSCLDVVYAEQRLRRWGRGMAPRLGAAHVPAFATVELQRALASLPLEDRLTAGFARRFLERRLPGHAPPPPSGAVAPLLRRRAGLARRRLAGRGAGRVPAELLRRPWFAQPPWHGRPRFIGWLRDDVLTAPLVAEALGEGWAAATRTRFLRGEAEAGDLTRWAASAVALQEALRELREPVEAAEPGKRAALVGA